MSTATSKTAKLLRELEGEVIEVTVYIHNAKEMIHHHTFCNRVKIYGSHVWIGDACFEPDVEVKRTGENSYSITYR